MKSFKPLSLSFLCLLFSVASFGQEDVNELLKENLSDGRKLIEAYAGPFMKSMALSMNQGWYNTAKTHKIVGFDLTITANAMTIPSDERFYEPDKLGLQSVKLASNSPDYPKAPTIFGPENEPRFEVTSGANQGDTFQGPPGLGLKENLKVNWIPVPMVHLGIGLPKNTDIKIRFSPTIDINSQTSLQVFGVGILHDIKQWIPGIRLSPFDLAAFVGYTKFKLTSELTPSNPSIEKDQKGVYEMDATTIQGIISKKISVLTIYGGLGYNIANSDLGLKGTYDINNNDAIDNGEKDPVALKFAASGPRTTVGMRLKLAVFTLHADYTLQKYNCLTVGFGIDVR